MRLIYLSKIWNIKIDSDMSVMIEMMIKMSSKR